MLENAFEKMFIVFLEYLPKSNIVNMMLYIFIIELIVNLTVNILKTISKKIIKF